MPAKVLADSLVIQTPSGLSFAEIGITGANEFVVIQNNTASQINLATYWLYEHNKTDPHAAGATTSTQQLPNVKLDPGNTLILAAAGQNTCGAEVADSLSVSLPDSQGSLELLGSSVIGGSTIIDSTDTDFVSWSNSSGGTIPNVVSANPQPVYYRYQSSPSPVTFAWQKASFDSSIACQLNVSGTSSTASTINLVAANSSPPAIIVAANSSSSNGIPADDIGLMAPQITELLPNPAGTGNDSTDEFVELYNPNDQVFDLTGFTLESGLTTKHDFTFDDGTALPAKSWVAFYSTDTGLTLSNTASQVWLLDPSGNIVSQTDSYSSAKDGQAWALAGGVWYWTSTPTPAATNLINGVAADKIAKSKTHTTPSVASTGSDNSGGGSAGSSSGNSTSLPTTAIHPWTLAGVGAAALLYAGYEYRTDLANNIYRIRRYTEARRAAGK